MRVYREFGDYEVIVESWLGSDSVLPFLAQRGSDGLRRGFTLVGLCSPRGPEVQAHGVCVADILAIAVVPRYQRCGIGRQLLEHAVQVARLALPQSPAEKPPTPSPEIQLTVAHDNAPAIQLFETMGFSVCDPEFGTYDSGQQAIRMCCVL